MFQCIVCYMRSLHYVFVCCDSTPVEIPQIDDDEMIEHLDALASKYYWGVPIVDNLQDENNYAIIQKRKELFSADLGEVGLSANNYNDQRILFLHTRGGDACVLSLKTAQMLDSFICKYIFNDQEQTHTTLVKPNYNMILERMKSLSRRI